MYEAHPAHIRSELIDLLETTIERAAALVTVAEVDYREVMRTRWSELGFVQISRSDPVTVGHETTDKVRSYEPTATTHQCTFHELVSLPLWWRHWHQTRTNWHDGPVMKTKAGSAYLIQPEASKGPGVLLLHSWWGLTPFFKRSCDGLADLGYTVLAPDLMAGERPSTADEAQAALAAADVNRTAALVLSSARTLRTATADPRAPIGVIGFSMGASWALWLSARSPEEVAATVAFYGTQSIDFGAARGAYLGHFAEFDSLVSEDEVVELEAHLLMSGRDTRFWRYPGTAHFFAESDRGIAYHETEAGLAWDRTVSFFQEFLPVP